MEDTRGRVVVDSPAVDSPVVDSLAVDSPVVDIHIRALQVEEDMGTTHGIHVIHSAQQHILPDLKKALCQLSRARLP